MHLIKSMAYVNEVAWHGLGNKLDQNQPLEIWAKAAGMDWHIESADVRFLTSVGNGHLGSVRSFPSKRVLYRSDSQAPLSVVSQQFQVVQPAEVLEFYRDLTEIGGFELETAGVLKEGRKLWALARTGHSVSLRGNDAVNGYLLLATACDGTLATTAQFTSVRVVCNNTLAIALRDGASAIKVGHRTQFDPQVVKAQLGIATSSWESFMARIKALSECRVTAATADDFLRRVLTYQAPNSDSTTTVSDRAVKAASDLYAGKGHGALLASSNGTAWGLLNSVTEFIDHHRRSRSADHRRDTAWFGQGATIKQNAWEESLKLVA